MSDFSVREKQIVDEALSIMLSRMKNNGHESFNASNQVKQFAVLKLAGREEEIFAGMLLDAQLRLIEYIEFFRGTIDGCAVYPRVVVKACLEHNAANIIFLHNHPSGLAEPSSADIHITKSLKDVLSVIDVRVIDHLVVGADQPVSFAERCLL